MKNNIGHTDIKDAGVTKTMRLMMLGATIFDVAAGIVSLIGLAIYCDVTQMVKIAPFILEGMLGFAIGYIVSMIGLYHLTMTVSSVMEVSDEKAAKKKMLSSRLIRSTIFILILIFIMRDEIFGIKAGLLYLVPMIGIKIGTYLVPVLDRKNK